MTPRKKFIADCCKTGGIRKLAGWAWDAMMLASSHDPEHARELIALNRELNELTSRVCVIERQLKRIGAPQYRRVYGGRIRRGVQEKESRSHAAG
jgi:hypothetical protein